MRRPLVTLTSILATALSGDEAGAQQREPLSGSALERFEPAPPGDPLFGVPSALVGGHLVPRVMVGFDYAYLPLVTMVGSESVVGGQGLLRVGASLALVDRLLLSLDMPFVIVQSGDDPVVDGVGVESPSSAAVGDLRLGARGRLVGGERGAFQLAPGIYAFLPTGKDESFAGDGAVRIEPHLALGGELAAGMVVWSAAAGYRVRTSDAPDAVRYGGGVAARLFAERLQVGPELYGSTDVGDGDAFSTTSIDVTTNGGTSAELLLGVKVRALDALVLGAAAGPGLSSAVGTPAARAVVVVAWSPDAPRPKKVEDRDPASAGAKRDRDGDGVPDVLDACLEVAGVEHGDPRLSGCPVDVDGDGVTDVADACPRDKGERSPDPKRNGCPPPRDADGDGIVEGDACPLDAGVATKDPATHGCPDDGKRDRDGDGVTNDVDACPNEKGAASTDPAQNGCPREVRVTEGEIVILKQVQFRFGASAIDQTIDPVSDDLLGEVKNVIHEHPEITKVEVQGHTDARGEAGYNAALSQARADSVRRWLVSRGIPPEKLVAKGYGASTPVGSNDTEPGRQRNRRVQFVIVARK